MRSKSLLVVLFVVSLLWGAVLAGASPASASDGEPTDGCYPFVHVHEQPGVAWDGSIGGTITVEPGEYHLHCLP